MRTPVSHSIFLLKKWARSWYYQSHCSRVKTVLQLKFILLLFEDFTVLPHWRRNGHLNIRTWQSCIFYAIPKNFVSMFLNCPCCSRRENFIYWPQRYFLFYFKTNWFHDLILCLFLSPWVRRKASNAWELWVRQRRQEDIYKRQRKGEEEGLLSLVWERT